MQYLADHPLPDGQVRTAKDIYEHAKDCLTQSYTAAVDEEHYKTELQTRVKKESETLNDYVQVILELCREAKVRSLSSKLKYLHAGLPLHLSTALRSTDYTDVPTFISVVQKLEATQRATSRTSAARLNKGRVVGGTGESALCRISEMRAVHRLTGPRCKLGS